MYRYIDLKKIRKTETPETKAFVDKWLGNEFTQGKEIHIVPNLHAAANGTKEYKDYVLQSQARVYEILTKLRPQTVGIEGFCGNQFSIQNFVEEQMSFLKEVSRNKFYSLKQMRFQNMEKINKGLKATVKYVLNKKVHGFGVEHPDLFKGPYIAITRAEEIHEKLVEEILVESLTPRTIYAIARCVQISAENPGLKTLAMVIGKIHSDELKILSKNWKLKLIYHEEAVNFERRGCHF